MCSVITHCVSKNVLGGKRVCLGLLLSTESRGKGSLMSRREHKTFVTRGSESYKTEKKVHFGVVEVT